MICFPVFQRFCKCLHVFFVSSSLAILLIKGVAITSELKLKMYLENYKCNQDFENTLIYYLPLH